MKAPQINREPVCKAKLNQETGWVEVFTPSGKRLLQVRSASIHTMINGPTYVKVEMCVKVVKDEIDEVHINGEVLRNAFKRKE